MKTIINIFGLILWVWFYFGSASMLVNGKTSLDKSAGLFFFGVITIATIVSLLKPEANIEKAEDNK